LTVVKGLGTHLAGVVDSHEPCGETSLILIEFIAGNRIRGRRTLAGGAADNGPKGPIQMADQVVG
jgi:hypothetical protein